MNRTIKLAVICAVMLCICVNVVSAQKTTIAVQTKVPRIIGAELRPFGNIPLYMHAVSSFETGGKAVLQLEAGEPMLVEVSLSEERKKRAIVFPLYLEPGKSISVVVKKPDHSWQYIKEFQGDLVEENTDLQKMYKDISILSGAFGFVGNREELEGKIQESLASKAYSADFEGLIETISRLFVEKNSLKELEKQPQVYQKALKKLLRSVRQENVWQSVFEFPRFFDDLFDRCEKVGLVKKSDDGFTGRLDYIGNETVRNRYALYQLNALVSSRTWFENPPKKLTDAITPYITFAWAKEELQGIMRHIEEIEQGWGHLRTAPAPDFTFEDVNGQMVTLSAFRGKFVLLDVWNIYCGPCMKQAPHLKKIEPELQKMGVEVIGVSCDPQDIKEKWRNTVQTKEMSAIQTIMDNGRKSKFMTDYFLAGFPTFCLIDPKGYVVNPYIEFYPSDPEFMDYIRLKIKEYEKKK